MNKKPHAHPVPAIQAEDTPETLPVALDAHGRDPSAYDWYPVLRRPRADGWTPARQRLFVETLADTASPKQAADAVGMSIASAYRLRRSPGAEGFAAAWDTAIHQGSKRLVDIAFERAVDGVDDPVVDADGNFVYFKKRYNDRLLMFLLRAHQPDRYRHAHRDARAPDEPAAPALQPVAEALLRLEPVRPERPQALMPPDELECRLEVADLMGGELPAYHRAGREEQAPEPDHRTMETDRKLDEVRRANAPGWTPDSYKAFLAPGEEGYEGGEEPERPGRRARRRARGRFG